MTLPENKVIHKHQILVIFLQNASSHSSLKIPARLKTQRLTPQKWHFEKYCWFEKACQFSALQGASYNSYLEKSVIVDIYM